MKKIIILSIFCSNICFSQSQIITTIAGNGTSGYSGDGGLAVNSRLFYPIDVICDHIGNLYITDGGNNAIRKIDQNGVISHFAQVFDPIALACDKNNNIYVISQALKSILKITPAGVSSLFAGTGAGVSSYSGDGGPATSATFDYPYGIAIDSADNVFVASFADSRIRKINSSGIISTIAGNGHNIYGPTGDGGLATFAFLGGPRGIAFDKTGNLYIAEHAGKQVRKINTAGVITKVAGSYTASAGYSGDGGPALSALLSSPMDVLCDSIGNIYISDLGNQVIRRVDVNGIIQTVVGNGFHNGPGGAAGVGGYAGDGGSPLLCELNNPWGTTFNKYGELIISDWYNHVIRKVSIANALTESNSAPLFSLYPNVGDGIYHINFQRVSNLLIYNALGQEIKSEKMLEGEYELNISNQVSGIYFVKVFQNGKQYITKLIKF